MSEKNLSEPEWKKFSKGKDYKDAPFVKALAALDKAKAPEAELEALAELEKQSDTLRKTVKSDKDLGGYLDVLDKSLDKQRKVAEIEAKKASTKSAASESESEEADSPDLLTTKMVPLLRQVKKGSEMQVLVAVAGAEVAVMLSRRTISPSRRKLMLDYLDNGSTRFYPGQCIFEQNSYTFVLKTQASGMAKKVKAALLKQVELRLKVRVRGEDPADIDDDGDVAEPDDAGEAGPNAASTAATSTPTTTTTPATPAASTTPTTADPATPVATPVPDAPPMEDPLKVRYDSRMAELEPQVLAMLRAQSGDVSKVRAVAAFVREKGEAGQYKAALAGIDSLVKLMGAVSAPATPAPTPAAATPASSTPAASSIPDAPPKPTTAGDKPAGVPATPPSSESLAFTARLAELKTEIQTSMAAGGEHGKSVKLKVSEAGVYAGKRNFEQAGRVLDELVALLAEAPPTVEKTDETDETDDAEVTSGKTTVKSGPSIVKQRVFMLERWARIPGELKVELGNLSKLIKSGEADEAPEELVSAIDEHLTTLLDDIQDQLDTGINKGDMGMFKGLRAQVESDDLMQHLASASFMDGSKFKQRVLDAMSEIEDAMAA